MHWSPAERLRVYLQVINSFRLMIQDLLVARARSALAERRNVPQNYETIENDPVDSEIGIFKLMDTNREKSRKSSRKNNKTSVNLIDESR